MTLKDKAAIVGIGATPYYKRGQSLPQTLLELAGKATLAALDDAGLTVDDVDGLALYSMGLGGDTSLFAQTLGIPEVRFTAMLTGGGGGAAGSVGLAAAAIASGMATCVISLMTLQQAASRFGASYAPRGKPGAQYSAPPSPEGNFIQPAGLMAPGQMFAVLANRHMHRYGTSREHFAEIVISTRENARRRETALMREPLDRDQYFAARGYGPGHVRPAHRPNRRAMTAPGRLEGAKILVTGPTSQVALPIATALAETNDVWGIARFSDPAARQRLDDAGVTCVATDLATSDFADLPDDFDYVLNFAVAKGGDDDWDRDFAANAESIGLLIARCHRATAVLHCSSTAVYQHQGPDHPLRETDPLGDNHRVMFPTYSLAKIAAEVVARTAAREHDVPTTIARLNVPYGDNGGWPGWHLLFMQSGAPISLHPERPNRFNPIHEDDIARTIPALLAAAQVPATIVNWGGETSSIEEWCTILGELTGLEPRFEETTNTLGSVTIDRTRLLDLAPAPEVTLRDGLRRLVAARHPDLLQ
jgi:UDP-glucuronate 4-epimerase